MDCFRLRSQPGAIWPPVPAAELSPVWAAYHALDRSQWLSPAELAERQMQQLRGLLDHCFRQVPYYHRLLKQAGFARLLPQDLEEFRRVPLLTRQLYQTHFADLQARQLPAGIVASWSGWTSGTNGVPLQVRKTNRDDLWWNALFLRDLEWSGLEPRGRLAAIRLVAMSREQLPRALEGIATPYWRKGLELLVENGPSYVMDIRQDPRRQLAWLRGIDPDYLLSMPSNLEFLAGLVRESGQRLPRLRAIQSIGEGLTDDARGRIEAAFGVPVKNLYSTTEAGYIASPCPQGHGLHVHAENVLAEVLDANDRPCLPGQTGRLVFTTLHNFLVPFVRYDILDNVTLAPGPCPCGRGLPLWTSVDGRRLPLLRLPDGRLRTVQGLVLEIRKVAGFHQFQIIQRAVDRFRIRVVPDCTWTGDHPGRLRQAVQQELGPQVHVEVEPQQRLDLPPGGKLKLVLIETEEGGAP